MAQGDVKAVFGSKTTIPITLGALANNGARESTVVDNTSNLFVDSLLRIRTSGQSGGTAVLNVWLYTGLTDTAYTDLATGSDAAFTAANIKNSVLLDTIALNGAATMRWGPKSIARMANLVTLPPKWGIIVENKSGAALSPVTADSTVSAIGVYYNVAPS